MDLGFGDGVSFGGCFFSLSLTLKPEPAKLAPENWGAADLKFGDSKLGKPIIFRGKLLVSREGNDL